MGGDDDKQFEKFLQESTGRRAESISKELNSTTTSRSPSMSGQRKSINLGGAGRKSSELAFTQQKQAKAVRIISIDAAGESFALDEKALESVLSSIPEDMKVAIVSVVGAFRTGKSFLLDLFLRYLKATKNEEVNLQGEPDVNWLTKSTGATNGLEGNLNTAESTATDDSAMGGFGWRSGKDRCTTGIWLWNEYFVRHVPKNPATPMDGETERVAVLLMDTQGMFDSTLGQMLTASIFGLSTLISSYQIYNLDKRVQEDNLQHLALFTEYGRIVLSEERKIGKRSTESTNTTTSKVAALRSRASSAASKNSTKTEDEIEWESEALNEGESPADASDYRRPFQRMELLVRDWQNFEDEDGDLETIREDMRKYLSQVLDKRDQKDLKQVREQIQDCFEVVSCFLLPHPGLEVPKRTYNGDVSLLRPSFRRLLSEYCRSVFSTRLVPKCVNGRPVSAKELGVFIKAYATLFKEAKIFPEAKTLLAATAEANNRAAVEIGLKTYRLLMDPFVGPNKPFLEESKLREFHKSSAYMAGKKFYTVATLGPRSEIAAYKKILNDDLDRRLLEYVEANKLRDPFSFVEKLIVPLIIALGAYVLRVILDWSCWGLSDWCTTGSSFLSMTYITIFTVLFFHMLATGHGVRARVSQIFSLTSLALGGSSSTNNNNNNGNQPIPIRRTASSSRAASSQSPTRQILRKKAN